jgi:hypothetical protein
VLSNAELKHCILRLADQWFGMTYVQIAIAVLVSVLGISNTLTVSITEKETGTGGASRDRQHARSTAADDLMEALALGAIGVTLGLALGAIHLFYQLYMIRGILRGYRWSMIFRRRSPFSTHARHPPRRIPFGTGAGGVRGANAPGGGAGV